MPRTPGAVAGPRDMQGTYTPSWSSTGTAPALGNGTISGIYTLSAGGRLLTVTIYLAMGSTTTYGSGSYGFSTPSGFTPAAIQQELNGMAYDTSASGYYRVTGIVAASTGSVFPSATSASSSSLVGQLGPFTWANGDTLSLHGVLQLA